VPACSACLHVWLTTTAWSWTPSTTYRRLIESPIRLDHVADMDALRRRMGAAQARIAQAPGATKGGNTTKRIRLRVDDGTVTATGGIRHPHDPWRIDDGTLKALGFKYRVPDQQA
jgi:hypothetical protein